MTRPRASKRRTSSPAKPRSIASGLIRTSVRSSATGASLLLARQVLGGVVLPARATSAARCAQRLRRERSRIVEDRRAADDRRLAVRADLPERLERRLAGRARLLELRRADRADQEFRLDGRSADRA